MEVPQYPVPRDQRKARSFVKTDGAGVLLKRPSSPSSIDGAAQQETPQRKHKLLHSTLLKNDSSKLEQTMAEGWKKLSDEERSSLKIDIFKPRSESKPLTYESPKGYFIHRSNSLTEQAKHLSEEEILALEIDIFKPLDFYELLFNRMKANNSGEIITSLSELDSL